MPPTHQIIENKYYQLVMLYSIYAYAVTLILLNDISDIFRAIFFIGSLPALWVYRKQFIKDPMFRLLLAVLATQIASWLNSLYHIPDFANSVPKLDRLAKLFTFLLMAFWLKGNIRNSYWLLGSLLIGIFIGFTLQPGFFNEISKALEGVRVDFNIKNAQFTSMFAGIALMLSVLGAWFAFRWEQRRLKKAAAIACLVLLALYFTFLTVVAQSRQSWLALFIVFSTLPIILLITNHIQSIKKVLLGSALIFLLFGILLNNAAIVQKRVSAEQSTVTQILSGAWDEIPMDSIGIRFISWTEAVGWIKKYPLIGIGANGPTLVFKQSEMIQSRISESPDDVKKIGHLHSNHIENLVAYGVLGFSCVLAMYLLLPILLYRLKDKKIDKTLLLFAICFVVYWLTINSFESFNTRSYGVAVHNIIFASLYHLYFYRNNGSKAEMDV
jgi:O-antigen ligase